MKLTDVQKGFYLLGDIQDFKRGQGQIDKRIRQDLALSAPKPETTHKC